MFVIVRSSPLVFSRLFSVVCFIACLIFAVWFVCYLVFVSQFRLWFSGSATPETANVISWGTLKQQEKEKRSNKPNKNTSTYTEKQCTRKCCDGKDSRVYAASTWHDGNCDPSIANIHSFSNRLYPIQQEMGSRTHHREAIQSHRLI